MTARTPAAQAARDRRATNRGEATGQAAPEPSGMYAAAQEQAKAKRQPLTDQSTQVQTMKAAIRMQESGSYEGDYTAQGQWIESQKDKSMGAYGIMSKNWGQYTNASGIPNANWRDSRSQDRVAGQMVNKLANQFGGNMGLVAAAWFAGADVTQRVVDKHGYEASVQQISAVLGDTIGDYASEVVSNGSAIADSPYGIENNLQNFRKGVGFNTPAGGKKQDSGTPQDAVRARLVALAGMQREEVPDPATEPEVATPAEEPAI
jgi:hypothetical protein